MSETIDITPTWSTAATVMIEVLQYGSPEMRIEARKQILYMAQLADAYAASLKAGI